jgi:hypothetical protein
MSPQLNFTAIITQLIKKIYGFVENNYILIITTQKIFCLNTEL